MSKSRMKDKRYACVAPRDVLQLVFCFVEFSVPLCEAVLERLILYLEGFELPAHIIVIPFEIGVFLLQLGEPLHEIANLLFVVEAIDSHVGDFLDLLLEVGVLLDEPVDFDGHDEADDVGVFGEILPALIVEVDAWVRYDAYL